MLVASDTLPEKAAAGAVPARAAVIRVAHHLGWLPEAAELRIVGAAQADRIKAEGLTVEGWPVSPLPTAWDGTPDLTDAALRPPTKPLATSYEIKSLKLCLIDLIAAGLLPTPAEKPWWSAAEAIAYLVKGVPLPWPSWLGAGASPAEIEQAEIDLGELIGARVPAQGRPS